jgi:phosphoserine aminotransferase
MVMFENFIVPNQLRPSDPRFGCGPSLIPVEHLKKLANSGQSVLGTSHRKLAVRNIVKEIQDGLTEYFHLPAGYEVVLGNGGATMLWDMIGLGLVEKRSSHFVCGEFSEKWFKAHQLIPWINAKEHKVANGQGINPFEEAEMDFICATLNETSTGVQISNIPKLKNSNSLMAIDATSGAGQIPVDFNLVDLFYFSPQKVFASEGGLFIAIMSPKAIERALKLGRDNSRYIPEFFKWQHAIENSRLNQTYNTPSLATLFLLNEQVKHLNHLGYKTVQTEAEKKAALLYGWADSKNYLSAFVKDAQFRSKAVATIDVDEKYTVEDLTKVLRAQNMALDIDAYRKLGRNQLRIAMFNNISYDDLDKLTKMISLAIEQV